MVLLALLAENPGPPSNGATNRRNSEDMFAPESVELLQKSGIDFQRHEEIGILPNDFSELMITSGLVLTDETRWISFHRCVCRTAILCEIL